MVSIEGKLINRRDGWILKVILKKGSSSKFKVIAKRWVVKRTFIWF
jgi:hypothetical protein